MHTSQSSQSIFVIVSSRPPFVVRDIMLLLINEKRFSRAVRSNDIRESRHRQSTFYDTYVLSLDLSRVLKEEMSSEMQKKKIVRPHLSRFCFAVNTYSYFIRVVESLGCKI